MNFFFLFKKLKPKIISQLIIVVVIFFFTSETVAQSLNYYVDDVNGNDSNKGLSFATAWKTLTKVNGKTFQPGDSLLFICGGIWTGQLYPKGSGNSSKLHSKKLV